MENLVKPHYKQFEGMGIPKDIVPLPKLSKKEITKQANRDMNIHKEFRVSLNCQQMRPNEIQIHTADIGVNHDPDYDFSDLMECDAWRKTCRLKYNLQQFEDVDFVRCENWLHKVQVCEALTYFEEVHRMLRVGGVFFIEIPDLYELMKRVGQLDPSDQKLLYYYERKIFSASDSTGLFFNRTIWSFDRISMYLEFSNFSDIQNLTSKDDPTKMMLSAKKESSETPSNVNPDDLLK